MTPNKVEVTVQGYSPHQRRKVWMYNPISGLLQRRTAYYVGPVAFDRKGTDVHNLGMQEWYVKNESADKSGMTGVLDVSWLFTTREGAVKWGLRQHMRTAADALSKIASLSGMPIFGAGLRAAIEQMADGNTSKDVANV